jgi:glutamyl/glutaminyl-tRNA synthetase
MPSDSANAPSVVTRFAPSPTGHLHIGGARTALFCWAYAQRTGGSFILRIEDTDQARSSDESARGIMEDLAWLGIRWDQGPELVQKAQRHGGTEAQSEKIGGDPYGVGPFFQARRVALYNKYIDQLIDQEKAYPAFDSTEELDALRKSAVARKETFRYDRTKAMSLSKGERIAKMKAQPHVVRLVAPPGEIVVHDQVLGDVKYGAGELDDFVLRKADGFPTYHFAVVVDDETMGVTHVLRAQEHLNNTPRHVALQRALGFRTPVYAHMPLIFNMDATKMGKRDKAKAARKLIRTVLDSLKKLPQGEPVTSKLISKLDDIRGPEELYSKILDNYGRYSHRRTETGPALQRIDLEQLAEGDSDSIAAADAIAKFFEISLPEIQVNDFREAGYLPEAIVNFLGLLGWNPGMKQGDGKDLEKFDSGFLAKNFSIDRIGRTNAKFDRVKLLSFNADYLAALSDDEFARRWLAFCTETNPDLARRLESLGKDRLLMLVRAVKPRAKTLGDASKPAAFVMLADDGVPFDPAAVEKNLLSSDRRGLSLLATVRDRLASLTDAEFKPDLIHALVEQVGQQSGAGIGPVSQAIRVALTGTGVSPGIGETIAVLGKASALDRIERCLKVHTT